MLAMEEILIELSGDERNEQGLPPGFRFHPTDEELVTFYLASKVFNGSFCGVEIAEVDLNRCEPWELPDVAKMGDREWYFFSLRDRKYPTGLRTNRATGAGYWKATGKDREVYSASSGSLLGMKKTLVFYKGRAPRGEKTKWVMHEYRLEGDFSYRQTCKEEWVICRIFHKMGDKKNSLVLQGQSYMLKNCSSQYHHQNHPGSLPPLLETSTTMMMMMQSQSQHQNPFVIHQQESDFKSLITQPPPPNIVSNSTPLPINGNFEPTFSNSIATSNNKGITINNNDSSSSTSSIIFKSFLSHQDFTLKELANTISKQCKTETSFNISYQNPLDFGMMDCSNVMTTGRVASTTSSGVMETIHEISSTPVCGFDRGGGGGGSSQMMMIMLDAPHIKVTTGDSNWALDV